MTTTELIAIMAAILEAGHGVGQLSPEQYVKAALDLYTEAVVTVGKEALDS